MNNTYGTHVLLEAARCAGKAPYGTTGGGGGGSSAGGGGGPATANGHGPGAPGGGAGAPPSSVRRFVNVSTDEVYGETSLGAAEGLAEGSVLEPTNPYSAAKAGAEMLCKAYWTSYRLPVIVTRGNNVYGPHQFPEKMVPKFTLLAARGKDLPIHGDGMVREGGGEGSFFGWRCFVARAGRRAPAPPPRARARAALVARAPI
jgi:hypothetical protein